MACFVERRWVPGAEAADLPRRARRTCTYRVYLPDRLQGRAFAFDGDVTADVADAEHSIVRFDADTRALRNTEGLARVLLRAESVASSRIEGLEVGARRLLRYDAERRAGDGRRDVTADTVLANIDAMQYGIAAAGGSAVTAGMLLEMHRRLLGSSGRAAAYAGRFRTSQNWIGGSSGYDPCDADFVPPPPERVTALIDDLCAFCNDDALPAIAQAAIAHAQFETIHPFADGNGRVGRALVHAILKRRGLVRDVGPPVSLVLATRSREYVGGLTGTRYDGAPDGPAARDGYNAWIATFASAANRAVRDAEHYEAALDRLDTTWRKRLGPLRKGSSVDLLLPQLAATPVLTVDDAARAIGRTGQAANEAVRRLVDAGILKPIGDARRNRLFEAGDVLVAFTELERRLASPVSDTKAAPLRRVPQSPSDRATPRQRRS
ncbi:MAG: Fic family protein [Candidatus Velthaea sp.]